MDARSCRRDRKMGMAGVWVVEAEGGEEGGAAVACPVRLGHEPSAGGTIFLSFLTLPPAAALHWFLFFLLGF